MAHAAYLEGVIVGHEFISAGKSFWITDDEEKEDEKAVWTKHLYVDAEESLDDESVPFEEELADFDDESDEEASVDALCDEFEAHGHGM